MNIDDMFAALGGDRANLVRNRIGKGFVKVSKGSANGESDHRGITCFEPKLNGNTYEGDGAELRYRTRTFDQGYNSSGNYTSYFFKTKSELDAHLERERITLHSTISFEEAVRILPAEE